MFIIKAESNCTISLSPVKRTEKDPSLYERLCKPFSAVKSFFNTLFLILKGELRAPLAWYFSPSQFVGEFKTLFYTWNFSGNPKVMQALLKFPRHDPEGYFRVIGGSVHFQQIFFDAFPYAQKNDVLLFCHADLVKSYRDPILKSVSPKQIKQNALAFDEVLEEIKEKIGEGEVNITKLCMCFTTTMISKLVLQHPGPLDKYTEIAEAVDCVNRYSLRRSFHLSESKEEKENYQNSLKVLKQAIEVAIDKNGSFVSELSDQGFSLERIQCTLLLMFFAGSETASSLLTYLIWELGQDSDLQREIYKEIKSKENDYQTLLDLSLHLDSVSNVFTESIRVFTPAYVTGREAAKDFEIRVKNQEGKQIFSKVIRKGEGFFIAPTFAARNPERFENPNQFDPQRFSGASKKLDWMPFGAGVHICPGQWLARAEVKAFTTWLVANYKIKSSPSHVTQQGFATLKLKETVKARLIPILKNKVTN